MRSDFCSRIWITHSRSNPKDCRVTTAPHKRSLRISVTRTAVAGAYGEAPGRKDNFKQITKAVFCKTRVKRASRACLLTREAVCNAWPRGQLNDGAVINPHTFPDILRTLVCRLNTWYLIRLSHYVLVWRACTSDCSSASTFPLKKTQESNNE